MGRAETYEHTADLGMRIYAGDLADLFQTAAGGLFAIIVDNPESVCVDDVELVELVADSTEELLVSWLNELIYRCETRHRLYARFEVAIDETGRSLAATIGGEPIDRARHVLDHEVKAATRHDLSIRRDPDGWIAELILDI